MTKVEQAVIPVAGYGTRRLPITKAIEKCMLPIGDRPIIDYVVEDYIKAGVEHITFVVGESSDQLQTYYGHNAQLEAYLASRNKATQLEQITALANKATFDYIVQTSEMPYGTAVPVALYAARKDLGDKVLISMGDELVYNRDGSSEMQRLVDTVAQGAHTAGLLATAVSAEQLSTHGVLRLTESGQFASIVECPQPEDAPSNLINISRYLFDRKLLDRVQDVMANPPAANGEFQLIEALNLYAAGGNGIDVVEARGRYLDCGTMPSWLAANNYVLGA